MPLDAERISSLLSPHGPLAPRLSGYEDRPDQVKMARAVAATLDGEGVLAVEAGTGTGKSLAYLVPAILRSRESGERVIVSTRTINLQEQLVKNDLPFLAAHLGIEFTAALVKGRRNYLCLRKAAELRAEPALQADDTLRAELAAILEWGEDTEDGSLADLGFVPRFEAWEQVIAEHDDCLRSRCPEYDACFFYKARRAAASADLLVINHHLLMADMVLRAGLADDEQGGLLPRASRLVIDEAHHLEDVATDYFEANVTYRRIERILSRLQHPRAPGRGILPALMEKLLDITAPENRPAAEGAARWIEERLRPRTPELLAEAARGLDSLLLATERELARTAGSAAGPDERQLRVVPEVRETSFWGGVRTQVSALAQALDGLADETQPVLERVETFAESATPTILYLAAQLRALAGRLSAAAADLTSFIEDEPDLCRWFSVRVRRDRPPVLSLCVAPVNVGPRLKGALFERFEGIVLTSATLTVDRRFDYFFERTGIADLDPARVEKLRIPSPYRFAEQSLIAVPDDLPEPDAPGHEPILHESIARIVEASGGGAFVLFTSYAALARAHAALDEPLRGSGLLVLRQGEASRHALLEGFRRNESSVLFATDSFWEGVDVRGRGLRAVIIARLPFRVPTEAIQRARVEAIEARGGNAFADYALPQAVIKLRQGFGRLIRSHEDVGVVAILDSRLARRRYGEVFLNSLPDARVAIGPAQAVFAEVEKFLGK